MANVLIAGCGYVGTALGVRLCSSHRVWGLRRNTAELDPRLVPVELDLLDRTRLERLPDGIELLAYTAAADASNDDAYRAAYVTGLENLLYAASVKGWPLQRIVFTSSTAVYAQGDGAWVDERSPTEPTQFSGQRMLEAERLLLASGHPATIARLGGIYGPGRARMVTSVLAGAARLAPSDAAFSNRIHRDDCAGALEHLLFLERAEPLYLAVDDEPASRSLVLSWLCAEAGVPAPLADPAAQASERRSASNKRCSNARLRASGYRFEYPTFRAGYGALLRAQLPAPSAT